MGRLLAKNAWRKELFSLLFLAVITLPVLGIAAPRGRGWPSEATHLRREMDQRTANRSYTSCSVPDVLFVIETSANTLSRKFDRAMKDVVLVARLLARSNEKGGDANPVLSQDMCCCNSPDWAELGRTSPWAGFHDCNPRRSNEFWYGNQSMDGGYGVFTGNRSIDTDLAWLSPASTLFPWILDRQVSYDTDGFYVACWIGTSGEVWSYYPGFNQIWPGHSFGDFIGGEYNGRDDIFVKATLPLQNPLRKPLWTQPYMDPAGAGQMISAITPIYFDGPFRGHTFQDEFVASTGIDILLGYMGDLVASVRPTSSSLPFVVDDAGHLVSAPQEVVEVIFGAGTTLEGTIRCAGANNAAISQQTLACQIMSSTTADWTQLMEDILKSTRGQRKLLPKALGVEVGGEIVDHHVALFRWEGEDTPRWNSVVLVPVTELEESAQWGLPTDLSATIDRVDGEVELELTLTNTGHVDLVYFLKGLPFFASIRRTDPNVSIKVGELVPLAAQSSVRYTLILEAKKTSGRGTNSQTMAWVLEDDGYPDCTFKQEVSVVINLLVDTPSDQWIPLVISVAGCVLMLAIAAFLYLKWKRRQADAVWSISLHELDFTEPPEVLGRGTYGLVVAAEYRKTAVAVKRVIPPSSSTGRGKKNMVKLLGLGAAKPGNKELNQLFVQQAPGVGRTVSFNPAGTSSQAVSAYLEISPAAPDSPNATGAIVNPSRDPSGDIQAAGDGVPPSPNTSIFPGPLPPGVHRAPTAHGATAHGPGVVRAPTAPGPGGVVGAPKPAGGPTGLPVDSTAVEGEEGAAESRTVSVSLPSGSWSGSWFGSRTATRAKSSFSMKMAGRGSFSVAREHGGIFGWLPILQTRHDRMRQDFVQEMRHVSKLRHPCITTVMGAVIQSNCEPMLVMELMEHGSLHDLIHNCTVEFSGELVIPILRHVAQGLSFLHHHPIVHGDVKAANVLVDAQFRGKVSDFGLAAKKFAASGPCGTPFWMAPELLNGDANSVQSDVYAFGITLFETYTRSEPYAEDDPGQVLNEVADPTRERRPIIPAQCPPEVVRIIKECWHSDPTCRPSCEEVDRMLKTLDPQSMGPPQLSGFQRSPSDRVVPVGKLLRETPDDGGARVQALLHEVFPKRVAEQLLAGQKIQPERKEEVTVFFSDIVGFTEIASILSGEEISDMLDRMYTQFDDLSRRHGVFKVETIGDAYMAVTNLEEDQAHDHAMRIASFASDAVAAAAATLIHPCRPELGAIRIRVGFHSGPVVANVVGTRNPRFCLFGDTVNTASRMESNSAAGRIHCSEAAATILRRQLNDLNNGSKHANGSNSVHGSNNARSPHAGCTVTSRGEIEVKGKGLMHTFWVSRVS